MKSATGSPPGARTAWNRTMLTMFGARIARARGTKRLERSSAPPITSTLLMSGNMYPVAARAPMSANALSGAGGGGMNCKKPFKPNTKKTSPRRSLAAEGAKRDIAFMVVFLSFGSEKRVMLSGGLDNDQLGVLSGDHRETTLVLRRDPVANGEAMAVHFHDPSGRRDIGVAESAELV